MHSLVDLLRDTLKEAKRLDLAESLGDCDKRLSREYEGSLSECDSSGWLSSEISVGVVLPCCTWFWEAKMALHRAIEVVQSKSSRFVVTPSTSCTTISPTIRCTAREPWTVNVLATNNAPTNRQKKYVIGRMMTTTCITRL
jgi:hypothetical protein